MTTKLHITSNVMKRIVGVEKKNLWRSLIVFLGIFASLFLAFVTITALFIRDVRDLGTWDVLTLFWEDREIVTEYWSEALSTFWLEVPTYYLYTLFVITIVAWIAFYATGDRRRNLQKRSQKLASYEKSGTMVNGGKKK